MVYQPSRYRALGCFGAGLIGVFAALALVLALLTDHLPKRFFDAGDWRTVERSDDYSRLEMVDALIWSGRLDGLTRGQVVRLLGPDCECAYFKEWDLVYWLGPERSVISLDSEWLVIRFGPDGRTSEYTLVTD